MLFPKTELCFWLGLWLDRQAEQGCIGLGFVPFGLAVLGSVTPRP